MEDFRNPEMGSLEEAQYGVGRPFRPRPPPQEVSGDLDENKEPTTDQPQPARQRFRRSFFRRRERALAQAPVAQEPAAAEDFSKNTKLGQISLEKGLRIDLRPSMRCPARPDGQKLLPLEEGILLALIPAKGIVCIKLERVQKRPIKLMP
eukprot:g31751.t1